MFWIKPSAIFGQVFSEAWWRMPEEGQCVYITFDDGPHPESTPYILHQLKEFDMKATFFCLGRSVEEYPSLFEQILAEGHQTGIHSYNHLNGWKVDKQTYLDDISRAETLINSKLFRPPYGKLSWSQWQALKSKYQIVMWSTMPEDFRSELPTKSIIQRLTSNVRSGDIVVLHENDKSLKHIHNTLPKYLNWLKTNGFTSKKLPHADR